jgi:hypothetical protein
MKEEMYALELASSQVRVAIAVENSRAPGVRSELQAAAHLLLGNWALEVAGEQESAMWAALELPQPAEFELPRALAKVSRDRN